MVLTRKKLNLNIGCGPFPLHQQHLDEMGDIRDWVLIDKYIKHPMIKNWDAEVLDEIKNETVDKIYSSHMLEHIPHERVLPMLEMWYSKLRQFGTIKVNVPDLTWAAALLLKYENGQIIEGYFDKFSGERGILSIIYGSQSHPGEYHSGGFVASYLNELLGLAGFSHIKIDQLVDSHDMGVLIATGDKV